MRYLIPLMILLSGCINPSGTEKETKRRLPKKIIDLSPVIDETIAERKWGSAALELMGFRGETNFIHVGIDTPVFVRNSYIEIFNHGGAHLDAPNHTEKGAMSVDQWDLNKLIGPIRIFDASSYKGNTEIPLADIQKLDLTSEDIFLLDVDFEVPEDDQLPSYPYLSKEACKYLASIPVKAVGTDALSIESFTGFSEGVERGLSSYKDLIPNHYYLMTNKIPLFEALEDLSPLLDEKGEMIFQGFPLKIKDGNGSPVRAVVFVY